MEGFQDQARSCLLRLWGPDVSRKFIGSARIPVPLPVSLDRGALAKITPSQRRSAWVSLKADGERCFLMFGCMTDPVTKNKVRLDKDGNPVLYVAEIGRKGVARDVTDLIKPQVSQDLFSGTLLDCEKMADGRYHVFDGIAIKGRLCINKPYSEVRARLQVICESPESIVLKPAFQVRRGKAARDLLENCTRKGSDGTVLTLEARSLRPGPCWDTLKFKEVHTVDLGVGPGGTLFVGDRGAQEEGTPRWWKRARREMFDVQDFPGAGEDFRVCEFEVGHLLPSGLRRIIYVKDRNDKSLPNTMQVFRGTVKAVEDRLTGKDVADLLGCE